MDAERWRALRTAFDELIELEAGPRSVRLAALRAEDEELAREVSELLAAEGAAGPLDVAPDASFAATDAEPGVRVGPWVLETCLGEGGMGAVWRARREAPRRTAALKLMRLAAPGSRALRRFELEAEVLARLLHPNVAQLYEAGVAEGPGGVDLPWMAVELVPGARHLMDYAREQALDLDARLTLLLDVADAVAHGHARGVVHRDLKSANVLVDEEGRVKVIDFGIARALSEGPGSASTGSASASEPAGLTRSGEILGSPSALAPEQLRGDGADVDTRTDVYALGVLLWELVAGRRPFEVAGLSFAELARRVERDPLPGLGGQPLADGTPAPRGLDWIVRRATEKQPAERYPGARELAADVRHLLADEPLSVGPASVGYRLRLFLRRHRGAVSALSLVATVVLVALTTILSSWREERDAVQRAARDHASMQRLADAAGLEELRRRTPELWPALPEKEARMRDWLAEAGVLVGGLPELRDVLGELEARAADAPAEGTLRAARDPDRWWARELAALVADLEAFAAREVPRVRALLDEACTLAERSTSGALARARWDAARERVHGTPRYGDLELTPQLGLLPLGPDPASGLEEFACLLSGSVPDRDAGGTLAFVEDSAVVFVLLPGGPSECAGQPVTLAPHFLAKHELTRAQWRRLFDYDPSEWRPGAEAGSPRGAELGRFPVERVPWTAAAEAARRFDCALVTEAQWEAAARATAPRTLEAWLAAARVGVPGEGPLPVGSLPADPLGLCDLQGNVSEWCADVFSAEPASWPRDPRTGELLAQGEADRVFRGAAFSPGAEWVERFTQPGWRMLDSPGSARENRGVRLARRVDPGP